MSPAMFNDAQMEEMMEVMGTAGAMVLGVLLVFVLLAAVIGLVLYILEAVGLYTIAKRRGIAYPWLAWIPVANTWLLGSVSDQYRYVGRAQVSHRRVILLVLTIVSGVLGTISGVVGIAASAAAIESIGGVNSMTLGLVTPLISLLASGAQITLAVFTYMTYYDLFMSCKPDNAVAFLVLSIFFGFLCPILVFSCRNQDQGMPPRRQAAPVQPMFPTPDPAPQESDFQDE